MIIVSCALLQKAGLGRPCCGSCHSDEVEGYSSLCGIPNLPEDMDADDYVCCSYFRVKFTEEELNRIRKAAQEKDE